jgi:hypothetical protein
MKLYSPLFIGFRLLVYALILLGVAEGIYFDAAHPMEEGYFGELTFTEIGQELILFLMFIFFLTISRKWMEIKTIALLASLFFLASFIREFNFLVKHWIYLVLPVLALAAWILYRDRKKFSQSLQSFFRVPASGLLVSGLLITYLFSRLFGRSKFWRLLYHDESYRLAKAATEEGLELLGNSLMLIAAFEFFLYYWFEVKTETKNVQ